jgi:opacity protein-like surface antigen
MIMKTQKAFLTLTKTKSCIAVLAVAALGATSALAADNVKKQYELKDGGTLIVYQDGKMAMKDKMGQTQGMQPGQRMETKDGQVLMMQGNEVWRLDMDTYRQNRAGK